MTSNDEVNALATNRFARVFGRREVFQLAPSRPHSAVATVPEEYLGRVIGIDGITYPFLDERSRQGWRMRTAPCGRLLDRVCESGTFVPVVRVVDGRMAFLCHNDAVPSEGSVVGLASPEAQALLDDPAGHSDGPDRAGRPRAEGPHGASPAGQDEAPPSSVSG